MISLQRFNKDDIPTLLSWLQGTDEEFLVQFAGTNYHFPLDEEQLRQTLEDPDTLAFKAVDSEGSMIGHCQLLRIDPILHCATIARVMVEPGQRNLGHGEAMVKALIGYASRELHVRRLILRVFDFNQPAYRCYRNLGFAQVSREAVYYPIIHKTWYRITMEWIG